MSLSCFSQTNTNNQSQTQVNDTTKVKLKPSTARLVIKDIVRGEGCVDELKFGSCGMHLVGLNKDKSSFGKTILV